MLLDLNKFLEFVMKNLTDYNSTICCPCNKCKNRYFKSISDVKFHCCLWGFHKAYKIWVYHGETYVSLHETQNHESMFQFMVGMFEERMGMHIDREFLSQTLRDNVGPNNE